MSKRSEEVASYRGKFSRKERRKAVPFKHLNGRPSRVKAFLGYALAFVVIIVILYALGV